VALGAALSLSSCANEVRTLSWEFQFTPAALGARAVVVEGRVIQGGCGGSAVLYTAEATRTMAPSGVIFRRARGWRW